MNRLGLVLLGETEAWQYGRAPSGDVYRRPVDDKAGDWPTWRFEATAAAWAHVCPGLDVWMYPLP